jgi:hypothetical protein
MQAKSKHRLWQFFNEFQFGKYFFNLWRLLTNSHDIILFFLILGYQITVWSSRLRPKPIAEVLETKIIESSYFDKEP